jgi:hypothetical protein
VHQRFAWHQCTNNDNTTDDFFEFSQTYTIAGFSSMWRPLSLPHHNTKNHLRDVSRTPSVIALCPFHRRGKFFAQLAHKDRRAERNRSKTSESGATDSPAIDPRRMCDCDRNRVLRAASFEFFATGYPLAAA